MTQSLCRQDEGGVDIPIIQFSSLVLGGWITPVGPEKLPYAISRRYVRNSSVVVMGEVVRLLTI